MPIERHDNSAVLFADISGSTKLFVAVGDERAREIVARTLELWSALTVDGGGHVIQLRGDATPTPYTTSTLPAQRRRRTVAAALALAAVFAVAAPAHAPLAQPPPRIVAIGDVHGAYDDFVALLRAAGLIDTELAWSGGATRLVLLGDVLDRGAGSRQALELVMRLHDEAPRAGGEAQLVLGNHEVLNLVGELSYVTAAEFAAYRDDELPAQRDAAWQRYRAAAAGARADATLAAEFATRYPPGFFGHRAAFAPHGRFGAWLLERPVVATIDRTAFVHGGLAPAVAGKNAAAINAEYHAAIGAYLDAAATLIDAGVLFPETAFPEQFERAARLGSPAARDRLPAAVRAAGERLQALGDSVAFRNDAVFWYRGTATCSAAIEETRLRAELRTLGVDRVVIGHTPTADRRVLTRFDGAVIRADTGMLAPYFGGRAAAVVLRGTDVRVLYADSRAEVAPAAQPRQVGRTTPAIDDDALERSMTVAPILNSVTAHDGMKRVEIDVGGARISALFRAARRGALADVAAYRLDRLLGAELVPVAVRREIDGELGSLRLDDESLPDERTRRARAQGSDAQCPLNDQYALMYAFDALTHNGGRSGSTVRYVPDGWRLTLGDNADAFGSASDLPEYLRAVLQVSPALAARLGSLNAEVLEQRLGDVLDEPRRAALLARRDRLVALATPR